MAGHARGSDGTQMSFQCMIVATIRTLRIIMRKVGVAWCWIGALTEKVVEHGGMFGCIWPVVVSCLLSAKALVGKVVDIGCTRELCGDESVALIVQVDFLCGALWRQGLQSIIGGEEVELHICCLGGGVT
eukprot:3757242-Prymnesium_polylepis.1